MLTKISCFGSIYKYELLKILKNKVAVITFLILFVYAFVQGQFEISGGVNPEDMEAYSMINGREIDDELLNELRDVTDEAGNLIDDKYVAYKHLNAWVLEVLDVLRRGASVRDLNAKKLYEDRVNGVREAHEALQLSEGEILYWSAKEASLDKPFRYHDTVISGGVLEGTTNYMIMAVLSQCLSLFPPTLVSSRLVYEFRLVKVGSYYLCYQAAPVLYGILTVIFLALGYVMYDRHEIKSN